MRAKYLLLIAGIAAMLVSLSALVFAPVQAQGVHDGWMHGGFGGDLPPALSFLKDIPKEQRFDHFLGGSMTVTDSQGTEHVITMTPGTVQSVSAQRISIVPNGSTTARTFNVTSDTKVAATPDPGSLQALAAQDKVVVVTVDDSDDAVIIHKHRLPPPAPQATPAPQPSPGQG